MCQLRGGLDGFARHCETKANGSYQGAEVREYVAMGGIKSNIVLIVESDEKTRADVSRCRGYHAPERID